MLRITIYRNKKEGKPGTLLGAFGLCLNSDKHPQYGCIDH
jgi:hypothetical protein